VGPQYVTLLARRILRRLLGFLENFAPLLRIFIAVTSNWGRGMSESLLHAASQPLP